MERILVVDSDEQVRTLMQDLLVAAGYLVMLAETGEIAVEVLRLQPADLMLLDVMMAEGMSGFDTCRAVRGSPIGQDVSILFVTAVNNPNTYQKALDAGADDFLGKPVHRAELLLRVRALLALRRMSRELAQTNELLRGQRDALLRAQRQKEGLTEVIVHDLKNPLAAIVANASFLTSLKEWTADANDAAGGVLRASESMLRMVYNLLDISRSEDGALNLQRTQVDIRASIRETCQLMARRAEERKQLLDVSLPDEGLTLWADADLIRRLVENLLDNALRYTPSRGRVRVSARSLGNEVELQIADEGPGIPEADRAKVFEKYARLDRPDDQAQQRFGRGLGLTFCKLVADAHAGAIYVEDNSPRGAVFCVRLPAALEASR